MTGWEECRCILCGSRAKRHSYMETEKLHDPDKRKIVDYQGRKYRCNGDCPEFGVPGKIHYFLSMDPPFSAELRKKISEHIVKRAIPNVFYRLSADDILMAVGKKIPTE